MGTWYYAVDGTAVGPVERDDLVALALDGTVGPATQVLDAGSTTWRTLAEAEGELGVAFPLFPTNAPGAVAPPGAPPGGTGWAAPTLPPPPAPVTAFTSAGLQLAAWWRRAAASCFDWIVLRIPFALLLMPDIAAISTMDDFVTFASSERVFYLEAGFAATLLVYQSILNARGQTLGKRLLQIRVVDVDTRESIGIGLAFRRQVLQIVGLVFIPVAGHLFFLVDALWPLWDARNQALHDKLGRSVVVRA